MRILLDTNVIIQSEDDKVLEEKFTLLHRLIETHGLQRFLHKKSIDDVSGDKNEQRKEKTLSKLKKYPILDFSDGPDTEFKRISDTIFP